MIIADRPSVHPALLRPRIARAAASLVALVAVAAALYYARLDLTLSHYDAKGHIIVARRILDSLTPGWQQIGAVWLPLPHLLNFLPVQIDAFYRSGISAVVISLASSVIAAYAIAALVARHTGSAVAALTGALLLIANPNTLYLQSTPMTEPLLIGLMLLSVLFVQDWIDVDGAGDGGRSSQRAGIVLFLACWTRYEAWPVTATLVGLAVAARLRRGEEWPKVMRSAVKLAAYPVAAGLIFLVISRITVGAWFVSSGFFVPENPALGKPLRAAGQVATGTVAIAGGPLAVVGALAGFAIAILALARRAHAAMFVCIAPLAAAALPLYAFAQGHPFRVRYMVVQVAALALLSSTGLGLLRRPFREVACGLLLIASLVVRPPLDPTAPMVREAQWDRPNAAARRTVTTYLRTNWTGEPIMASMGSLGHYMQELSEANIFIRDFLHEGNGDLWKAALSRPARHVRWVLIEEKAEGGDMLAERARKDPSFLEGFTRAAWGGGVALYQKDN